MSARWQRRHGQWQAFRGIEGVALTCSGHAGQPNFKLVETAKHQRESVAVDREGHNGPSNSLQRHQVSLCYSTRPKSPKHDESQRSRHRSIMALRGQVPSEDSDDDVEVGAGLREIIRLCYSSTRPARTSNQCATDPTLRTVTSLWPRRKSGLKRASSGKETLGIVR